MSAKMGADVWLMMNMIQIARTTTWISKNMNFQLNDFLLTNFKNL